MDQFSQCSHKSLVSLHPSSGVNQNNIVALVLSILQCLFGNNGRIVLVPLLIARDVQAGSMSLKLFNGSAPKVVAPCQHDLEVSLALQVVSSFGQGGTLPYAIDSDEYHWVHQTLLFVRQSILQDVYVFLRGHDFRDWIYQCFLAGSSHGSKRFYFLADKLLAHRLAKLGCNFIWHIFLH